LITVKVDRPGVGKKIQKLIKDAKLKLPSEHQGDAVRVSGPRRTNCSRQSAGQENVADFPIQVGNFKGLSERSVPRREHEALEFSSHFLASVLSPRVQQS